MHICYLIHVEEVELCGLCVFLTTLYSVLYLQFYHVRPAVALQVREFARKWEFLVCNRVIILLQNVKILCHNTSSSPISEPLIKVMRMNLDPRAPTIKRHTKRPDEKTTSFTDRKFRRLRNLYFTVVRKKGERAVGWSSGISGSQDECMLGSYARKMTREIVIINHRAIGLLHHSYKTLNDLCRADWSRERVGSFLIVCHT